MSELLLKHGNVLDPRAGTLLGERDVLIRDGVIAGVGETLSTGSADREIDLKGLTLMPGLCDAHVHVTATTANFAQLKRWSPFYVMPHAARILEGMLSRGFTTVRDAGGADWGLAQAVEEGALDGPRVLFCGHALSQTGGHADVRGPGEQELDECFCCAGLGAVCDGVAEVRRACREEIRRGATQIKLMVSGGVASPTDRITSTQFAEEEIRAAVEEADAAQIPVMAHAYTARAVNRALRCGVDSIEHGNLIDESSVEHFKTHDAWLVPTLSVYDALSREGVEAGMPPELNDKVFDVLDHGIKAVELAYRGGVKMAYGTDLLGQMHRHQLNEFALRAQVVSPVDLVRAATCNAAELFRMDDRIGRVVEDYEADLIAVAGNPLEDINVLHDNESHLKLVIKAGRVVRDNFD